MKTQLEVKVLAVNTLNEYAKKFYEYEMKHFSQFKGINIFKADGSIKSKFEHERINEKKQLPDGTWVNASYWFDSSYSTFEIRVRICVNGGSYDVKPSTAFCQYEEQSFVLFQMDKERKLIENTTYAVPEFKTDYNVSELQAIAAEIKAVAEQYEAVSNKMPYIFKDVCAIERLRR